MTSEQFNRPGAVDLSHLSQSAGAAAGGNYVMALTEAEFEQVAAKSMQHPVVLEFYSPRDPNGEAVSKAFADAVNAEAGRFLLGRVNVDEQPRIAQALGVQAVPTVVALIAGQMAPLFQGTKSAEEIKAVLGQVAQAAVANGMTGRAEPVGGEATSSADDAQPANPKFAAADAALEAGDYAKAVEEFDKLLQDTPNDVEVIAGRAQASLLERSTHFDPAQVVANAGDDDDLQAQLEAADLEVIQGANEQALERLLDFAATASPEDKEAVRVRVLELFEVIGRTDPVVLKARRRLATVLF
uniref:tetratricopeptide repeat protein n=1 Tax=Tessaracoccus timonensis TaxID=2161816 RepID=UPI000D55738E|nr:tetratricopeptide repeat protein [Tessaracoccus timonensis]